VDLMIQRGLIDEIKQLRSDTLEGHSVPDYTQGIFQAIGYKEFHDYLSATSPSQALLESSVNEMKHATKKYAQRQIKWMRNKLLPAIHSCEDQVAIVILDATELDSHWHIDVKDRAKVILHDYLAGQWFDEDASAPSFRDLLRVHKESLRPLDALSAQAKATCAVCTIDPNQPVMYNAIETAKHLKSRRHRRAMGRVDKQERFRIWRQRSAEQSDGLAEATIDGQKDVEIHGISEGSKLPRENT